MEKHPSLLFCIVMDLLGCATYLLPVLGEWIDIAWAPISAYLFYKSFGGRVGQIGSVIHFIEEVFPFIDFIPSYLLGYIYVKVRGQSSLK